MLSEALFGIGGGYRGSRLLELLPILDFFLNTTFFLGGWPSLTQVGDGGGEGGACGRGALGVQHGGQHRPVRVRICSRTSGCSGIWKEMFEKLIAPIFYLPLKHSLTTSRSVVSVVHVVPSHFAANTVGRLELRIENESNTL